MDLTVKDRWCKQSLATDLIGPIFEYGRDVGRNGIGGFIYRGTAIPELVGNMCLQIRASHGRAPLCSMAILPRANLRLCKSMPPA